MDLLQRIERHLKTSGTAPSRFGRDALGDPGLVAGLRNGREPRARTIGRVLAYLDRLEGQARAA